MNLLYKCMGNRTFNVFAGEKFPGQPRVAVYFVLGSWCLAAFVLISAYNSVLVSYILGSNAQPLVNSVTDIAVKPDVRVSVNKGNEIDLVLSVITNVNVINLYSF